LETKLLGRLDKIRSPTSPSYFRHQVNSDGIPGCV